MCWACVDRWDLTSVTERDALVDSLRERAKMWTFEEAVALCRLVESVAPKHGCHIALTGGCLYKDGTRKDCDVVVYRIRQADRIDSAGLMQALVDVGITLKVGDPSCWLMKAEYEGKKVDFFFPENEGGDYGPEWDDVPPTVVEEAADVRF
jgi:hypothetical protein